MKIRMVGLVYARKYLASNYSVIVGMNGYAYFVNSANEIVAYCDNHCLAELAQESDYIAYLLG